jgi:hypothetical protein
VILRRRARFPHLARLSGNIFSRTASVTSLTSAQHHLSQEVTVRLTLPSSGIRLAAPCVRQGHANAHAKEGACEEWQS